MHTLIWLPVHKANYVTNKPGYQWYLLSKEKKIHYDANDNDFTYTTQFSVDPLLPLAGNTI
jgi:hypothetical protein